MPEIGTSGSMSEDEKRSDATWPQRPRSSSTLPFVWTGRAVQAGCDWSGEIDLAHLYSALT
jgi:hypothetical protein